MKGSYHIIVQNRHLKYEFDIRRNLTIIQGNSATGKTTLIEMIREHNLDESSGVTVSSACPCQVVEGNLWKEQISIIRDSIIFIDEGSSFVETEEFASEVKRSSNYFVLVTRENLEMLPVSVDEVYGIRSSGKFSSLKAVYHEMYHIYDIDKEPSIPIIPDRILVEDSNSGYEFFCDVARKNGLLCSSAQGKAKVYNCLLEAKADDEILVIADGAAFASQMNRIGTLVRSNHRIHLYLPESFEWLLLSSGIIADSELSGILKNPADYIDSAKYFSWERFFTSLIVEKTKGSYLQYSKSRLNNSYLQKNIQGKVLACMKGICFNDRLTDIKENF
jgi:hypothetical protein